MTHAQRFALQEWLVEYPEGMDYYDILALIRDGNADDGITRTELIEYCDCEEVYDIIESTHQHFIYVTSKHFKPMQEEQV